ncbi:MAG: hypothetical protein LWW97_11910 [Deltaproteobacteria bacterium]|nr:hypothetical protein [Deltaproteobacteria bacterium]
MINLGTGFSLPRNQWSELSSRIQEIISGQQSFFKISEEIEELAQNYAAKIIQAQQKNKAENDQPDYHFEPALTGVKGYYLLFLQQIVGFYLSFNPENPWFIKVALFYFGYTQFKS